MSNPSSNTSSTTFRDYFDRLEELLGMALIPINSEAAGPKQIILSEALHADLAKEAAITIYRENHCRSMGSPIYLMPTLDALGCLRYKAEYSMCVDKDAIEFIESLGEATLSILRTKNYP